EMKSVLLRYFNPVGAHPSILLGELPLGKPENLVPAITQTAIGKIPQLTVYGTDYSTRDGSCLRDYIHVCDIARAHTLSLRDSMDYEISKNIGIFSFGTGERVTVLEAIVAFDKVSGIILNYIIVPRRPGDVVAIYANNSFAKDVLKWESQFSLED